ncbi:MAG TPA: single-stranded DNA-binding protein [Sporichthyaceae bacterium]|nr:single-stranded DNA-binding protein [Sporichthyaceae bacterium]
MNETWVTIVGNVADDPRHMQTAGGVLTAFRLAHTPRSERDGVWGNGITSFYDVACFRRLADHVAGSVVKGEPVIVHGRLRMREWQKDDRKGRDAQIVASHIGHDLAYGVSSFRRPRRDADVAGAAGEPDRFAEPVESELEPNERADSAA